MTRTDRLEVSYDLTFETPFHFGTGLRVGLVDRTVVRDHDGYLYVPGSTIKGVVREQCDWLAASMENILSLLPAPTMQKKHCGHRAAHQP